MRFFLMIDGGDDVSEYGETRPIVTIRERDSKTAMGEGEDGFTCYAENIDGAIGQWHRWNGEGTLDPYFCSPIFAIEDPSAATH